MPRLCCGAGAPFLPGPEPDITCHRSVSSEDLDTAAQQVSVALDRVVSARADHVDAERKLQAAREADDAMRRLENLLRAEAGDPRGTERNDRNPR